MTSNIVTFDGKTPKIAADVFIAPNAMIIGDVEIGAGSSIWFGCVLRGDIGPIRIGRRTNIQDLVCVHMTDGVSTVVVGDDVTVGHGAILHGTHVGDGCLIGMGSILLDNTVVGAECLVAAGSLLSPRFVVPARSVVRGSPAKVLRPCTDDELAMGRTGAEHYVHNASRFRALFDRQET
ncbi:MAG: gamma carbonic anhydrase family protein [Polyangiaceae bacterium]